MKTQDAIGKEDGNEVYDAVALNYSALLPYFESIIAGVLSGVLVLSGWRYLPHLIEVHLFSYFLPLPVALVAWWILAHRYPASGPRLALVMSLSFELVIFLAGVVWAAPPEAMAIQVGTGLVVVFITLLTGSLLARLSRLRSR